MADLFLVVAVVLFAVAAFLSSPLVASGHSHTISWVGLAFFAAAFLVGRVS